MRSLVSRLGLRFVALLYLAVILVGPLVGPSQIPKMARGFGQAIREFKKAQREIGDELERDPPPQQKNDDNKPIQ